LPNADFNYQTQMVEQWKAEGYPSIVARGPLQTMAPSSVRKSWSDLILAVKRSILFRSPTTFKVLRPIYRAVARRNPRP